MDPAASTALPFVPPAPLRGGYDSTLAVLNRQSVLKHYDAYGDIAWDKPEFRIDHSDPSWELQPDELLFHSTWYQSQSVETKRRIGLDLVCTFMRIGSQFENTLVRGLLEFAHAFPDDAPERRYAMHEAVEECQHIQMFREFVARSGLDVPGMPERIRGLGSYVVGLARRRPALFWVFVMGGEDPIDFVQRRVLAAGRPLHPLVRQIVQIHVTEEARHLCFARMFIANEVKSWSKVRRHAFGIAAVPVLDLMTSLMLGPNKGFVERNEIPAAAIHEAYGGGRYREQRFGAVAKIRDLFEETGLLTPDVRFLWRQRGLA